MAARREKKKAVVHLYRGYFDGVVDAQVGVAGVARKLSGLLMCGSISTIEPRQQKLEIDDVLGDLVRIQKRLAEARNFLGPTPATILRVQAKRALQRVMKQPTKKRKRR